MYLLLYGHKINLLYFKFVKKLQFWVLSHYVLYYKNGKFCPNYPQLKFLITIQKT